MLEQLFKKFVEFYRVLTIQFDQLWELIAADWLSLEWWVVCHLQQEFARDPQLLVLLVLGDATL